ncbi:MAG TPA: hypothetical protein PLX77_05405 [Candidatus Cloacimonadota bacterium]|nr:hypothetical protein [Candidatus Cloacimonadota bacterium]
MSESNTQQPDLQLVSSEADTSLEAVNTRFWNWLHYNLNIFLPIVEASHDEQALKYAKFLEEYQTPSTELEEGKIGMLLAPFCTKCGKVRMSFVGACPGCNETINRDS